MYHYTYRLTLNNNTDSRKYYIGARSCTEYPTKDSYFGSCKTLLAWIKEYGTEGIVKEILAIYGKRQDAIEHEINLHNYFDVAKNVEFWNKAKQTSVGFDTSGTTQSEELKLQKSLKTKGRPKTEEHKAKIRNALLGKTRSKEHCEALSKAKKGIPSPLKGISVGKGRKFTEEHKIKIGLANKGKVRSDEYRLQASLARLGKPATYSETRYAQVTCPHCNKIGMKANMTRYHFNNCKNITGVN